MNITEQPLPGDETTERHALAGLLWLRDLEFAHQIIAETPAESFKSPKLRAAYDLIIELAQARRFDPSSFIMEARNKPEMGGMMFAVELEAECVTTTPEGVRSWFAQLREMAHRRDRILQMTGLQADLYVGATTAESAEALLAEQRQQNRARYSTETPTSVRQTVQRLEEYMANLHRENPVSIETGIPELDRHGPIPPEYCLILARSTHGKTALMLSLTIHLILTQHKRVLVWTGEQPAHILVAKCVSIITGRSYGQVVGVLGQTAEQREATDFARNHIAELPLHFLDGPQTVARIWSYAQRLQQEHGDIAAVFLDQFDRLIVDPKIRSKEQQLGKNSLELHEMTKSIDRPVFLLAQLGLKHQKDSPAPSRWQIRDCSQAVQDCDRAYVIDRPQAEPQRMEALRRRYDKIADKGTSSAQMNEQARLRAVVEDNMAVVRLEKNRNGLGGAWEERIPFSETCGRFGKVTS